MYSKSGYLKEPIPNSTLIKIKRIDKSDRIHYKILKDYKDSGTSLKEENEKFNAGFDYHSNIYYSLIPLESYNLEDAELEIVAKVI